MQTKVINSTTVMVLTLLLVNISDGSEEREARRVRHHRSSNRTVLDLEQEFSRNLHLVHSPAWNCSDPKPRLVYWDEAVDEVPAMSPHTFWPVQATVMHRCDPAFGCCSYPSKCQPIRNETVTITFKSIDMNTSFSTYHPIRFLNHTKCGCSDT